MESGVRKYRPPLARLATEAQHTAIEGSVVHFASKPVDCILDCGEGPVRLHHMVDVDQPAEAMLVGGDLPTMIGVAPKCRVRASNVGLVAHDYYLALVHFVCRGTGMGGLTPCLNIADAR
jgi:hypothetical protein